MTTERKGRQSPPLMLRALATFRLTASEGKETLLYSV